MPVIWLNQSNYQLYQLETKLISTGSLHLPQYYSVELRLYIRSYVLIHNCTGFFNAYNYVLEFTSLISSFGINHVHQNGPGTIYMAGDVDFTVSIIYSDQYLTDDFGLYSRSKLKIKNYKLKRTKSIAIVIARFPRTAKSVRRKSTHNQYYKDNKDEKSLGLENEPSILTYFYLSTYFSYRLNFSYQLNCFST